jgi:Cu+-exporting ATPase
MTMTFTFAVTGMHCASCGLLIDETLEDEVPGVLRCETSVRKGQTIVHAEAGADPAVLAAAIAAAGYQATLEAMS